MVLNVQVLFVFVTLLLIVTSYDLYNQRSGRGKCSIGEFQSLGTGQCVSCGYACTDCNSYGICLQCQSPYFLETNGQYFPYPYCRPCRGNTQCSKQGSEQSEEICGSGYFQSLETQQCIACGFACKHCSRIGQCIQCNEGYKTNSQYLCIPLAYYVDQEALQSSHIWLYVLIGSVAVGLIILGLIYCNKRNDCNQVSGNAKGEVQIDKISQDYIKI